MTWWDAIVGLTETALDFGASFVPGGNLLKRGLKWGLKGAKFGTGVAKDYFAGGNIDFDGLSSDIGDLKNGLAGAKAQIETQGKELHGKIDTVKTELLNQMNQQGAKFDEEIRQQDAKIANLAGEQKKQAEEQKKALQKQKEELERGIKEVQDNLNQVENKLTEAINDLRNEVNERFEQQEKKILDNKRKIEEERIQREEEIRETHSKIKLTNTNLENLRKEKSQLEDDFLNYKSSIDRKTAETDQNFEDLQAEYERKKKIIETKLADNEELLQEFQEDLINVKHEQAQQKLFQQEFAEELSEQSDLLHFQKHQLNLVAQQMEEVSEEIHQGMSGIKKDHHKLFTLATETSQKVDNLTNEVRNISQKTSELESQIKENKQTIEEVKKEAKWANERLDNYIKSQQLLDHSAEELAIAKIQKSLELKAEETKLLATLNLLQETKKLIPPQVSERDWKVGVQTGTAPKDLQELESFQLAPNSDWEKKYTGEQIKPNNPYQLFTPEWFQWEQENKLTPEETKLEWGERIKSDQESAPLTDPEKRQEQQTETNQTKNEGEKEQKELFLTELEEAKTEILTRLQEIQQQIKQNLTTAEKQKSTASAQPKVKKTPANFAEELEQQLAESKESLIQDQQKELEKEWSQIQDLSEQVLTDQPKEPSELDINQKTVELTQQIKEMEANQVASQKQMTKWMLFLIIFLLEYVVYKKNGVLGLVILNVILAIAYYKKEEILKYQHLWQNYFLIIGYVIGNTLAYSAPEPEKYKWPSVIAFNLIILGIYGYTYWQNKQAQAKIEAVFQEKTNEIKEEHNISDQDWKTIENNSQLANNSLLTNLNNYNLFANQTANKLEQINNLQEFIQEQEQIKQNQAKIQQQSELLQQSAQIENNLKEIQANLGESKMSWTKIKERYPQFAQRSVLLKELVSAERILGKDTEKKLDQNFLTKLTRLPVNSLEENNLLSQLRLTIEQFIALSQQAYRFTKEEQDWLSDNYSTLTNQQQLQLLNAGLNNLGVDSLDQKEIFVDLNHQIYQEKQYFGLSVKEKENILKFIHATLDLTPEQKNALEEMGIKPYNASEWEVSEEQKDHLLDFGLNKLKLTAEQQANLTNLHPDQFKTFSLTGEQKNILNSLAPLIREDKYSNDSLQLLNSLLLKPVSQTFLVQEEIIPDPHTAFGTAKSSYLPLKEKFLKGEQKTLSKLREIQEKKFSEENLKSSKLSILKSLQKYAWGRQFNYLDLKVSFTLDDWIKEKVFTGWQRDILLTCGFKTVPKYNFFELLIFAVEKFAQQNWDEFLVDKEDLAKEFADYLDSLKNQPITINETIWEKFVASQTKNQQEIFKNLNLEGLINQKINQALAGYQPKEEVFYDSSEELEETEKKEEQTSSSTSRYDSLLDNLNKEDAEREKKKQERQAAKNKLAEAERNRREQKLTEKEQKLKEDEAKRQQERELAELEEKKRREAEEARSKAFQEEQEEFLKRKSANIEEKRKRTQEALENQKKQNELDEQKKKDEIKKLEEENQLEQARLANQAQLIEEEKQKKLASIALEDQEQRQLIEKRANEEKARIQQEMADKKRQNEAELKRKENELLRQQQTQQIELDKMQKEAELATKVSEEMKVLAARRVQILRNNKNHEDQLRVYRDSIWNDVLDYFWAGSEASSGTRSPIQYSSGTLRSWLNSNPSMEFNLVYGDKYGVNWVNNGWKRAMKAFYGVAGNTFVNQYRFRELLNQQVKSLTFIESIPD